ncbi:MAG TPA: S-layer homology domain-containing protein [Anaerolineales bacterium]|nr:S-layer homology domain-containing protein [Anaerolineales bacterium]
MGRPSTRIAFALLVQTTLLAIGPLAGAQAQTGEPPVLLGLYSSRSLQETGAELLDVDQWLGSSGRGLSLAGTFMDLEWPEPAAVVPAELNAAWNRGYVPVVNLMVGTITESGIQSGLPDVAGYPKNRTAAYVADSPAIEPALAGWAKAFAQWSEGGRKRAFLAPLHEMNGEWVSYGVDPQGYQRAYRRIQNAFRLAGVPDGALAWVFSPNGWSDDRQGHPRFEAYYPGNSAVDIVAFSSFNYGKCPGPWAGWQTYDEVFAPYLDRLRALAPSKPIFIAQTGTVDLGGDKNLWLNDSYTRLAAYPGVRAILYFHKQKNEGLPCDPVEWRFFAPASGVVFPGILDALSRPENGFGSWPLDSTEWATIVFGSRPSGNRFEDVERSHPFAGVPDVWYYRWVEALAGAGISDGCGTNPDSGRPIYCPQRSVTRAEMAVFLLKGIHGAGYRPPTPQNASPFTDVGGHWAMAWIEAARVEGLVSGHPDGSYRPEVPLTRGEMAAMLLKARHGAGYRPPASPAPRFWDIGGHWARAWIDALSQEQIASGYPDGSYRPDTAVTRAEMAAFLGQTFGPIR